MTTNTTTPIFEAIIELQGIYPSAAGMADLNQHDFRFDGSRVVRRYHDKEVLRAAMGCLVHALSCNGIKTLRTDIIEHTPEQPPVPTTELYFEAHVTIDPVPPYLLDRLKVVAGEHDFRVADLLMVKTGEPSKADQFMTARHEDYKCISDMTRWLVEELKANGFRVRRYKIENTLVDVREVPPVQVEPAPPNVEAAALEQYKAEIREFLCFNGAYATEIPVGLDEITRRLESNKQTAKELQDLQWGINKIRDNCGLPLQLNSQWPYVEQLAAIGELLHHCHAKPVPGSYAERDEELKELKKERDQLLRAYGELHTKYITESNAVFAQLTEAGFKGKGTTGQFLKERLKALQDIMTAVESLR